MSFEPHNPHSVAPRTRKESYIHDEVAHNLRDPTEIVPLVFDLLRPASVVDIGCGLGTFLKVFKDLGVPDVLGLDGPWANSELVGKHLTEDEFIQANLQEFRSLPKKYDLAVCVEVAEHIDERYADTLVRTLVHASDVILFSAGIPGQGGQLHVNERWPSFWRERFNVHNFFFHDVIRSLIWDNEKVALWYRQNIFLVAKKGYPFDSALYERYAAVRFVDCVHPELFSATHNQLQKVMKGKAPLSEYFKLAAKAVCSRLGLYD